jgi:hypothetical protein
MNVLKERNHKTRVFAAASRRDRFGIARWSAELPAASQSSPASFSSDLSQCRWESDDWHGGRRMLRMVGIDVFPRVALVRPIGPGAWGQRIGEMHMPLDRLVPIH